MIELVPERLSSVLEQKLRKWLSQPEANILRRVVAARCQLLQAEALNKALHAKAGENSDLIGQDALKQAARFDSFNQILTEFSEQPKGTPFEIARLQTTTTNADTNIADADGAEET